MTALVVVLAVIASREVFNFALAGEIDRKIARPVSKELIELRKQEDYRLTTYQWVDEQKGLVHMPVTRAKELVEARDAQLPLESPEYPAPPEPETLPIPGGDGGAAPTGEGGGAPEGATPTDTAPVPEEIKLEDKKEEKKPGGAPAPAPNGPAPKAPTPPKAPAPAPQPAGGDPY